MKNLINFLLTFLVVSLNAQEFQLPIYLEDSAGSLDTIILGYDPEATINIDSQFGESNILGTPYLNDFEVRACLYDYDEVRSSDARLIESKKMFVEKPCTSGKYFDEAHSFMVIIKSDHWPIKISWDNSLIEDTCQQLTIVDCTPGGWLHICGPGYPYRTFDMRNNSSAIYDSSEYSVYGTSDSLKGLFFAFNLYLRTSLETQEQPQYQIFPNPSNGELKIYASTFMEDDCISIYNLSGTIIHSERIAQSISLYHLPNGIYPFIIKNENKVIQTGRLFIKKE